MSQVNSYAISRNHVEKYLKSRGITVVRARDVSPIAANAAYAKKPYLGDDDDDDLFGTPVPIPGYGDVPAAPAPKPDPEPNQAPGPVTQPERDGTEKANLASELERLSSILCEAAMSVDKISKELATK